MNVLHVKLMQRTSGMELGRELALYDECKYDPGKTENVETIKVFQTKFKIYETTQSGFFSVYK